MQKRRVRFESFPTIVFSFVLLVKVKHIWRRGGLTVVVLPTQRFVVVAALSVVLDHL